MSGRHRDGCFGRLALGGANPMGKYTHDEPLSITSSILTCCANSFDAANSLVHGAQESDLDRDLIQQRVDQAVGFGRAYDVQHRVHMTALGYRAKTVRPRGVQ
jgi:hypothetical protein